MPPTPKSDLPQGTLDLLILKAVALGPVHGYAIAQRLEQVSRHVVQVPQGSLYPALHRLEKRGFSPLIGDRPTPAAKPNSTGSRPKGGSNLRPRLPVGGGSPVQ